MYVFLSTNNGCPYFTVKLSILLYHLRQHYYLNPLFADSFFTERYLGFPSQQFLEYEKADLTKRAGNMKGKHYLLVHGTSDTTVKPQHSMKFARALIEQEVMFQQLVIHGWSI